MYRRTVILPMTMFDVLHVFIFVEHTSSSRDFHPIVRTLYCPSPYVNARQKEMGMEDQMDPIWEPLMAPASPNMTINLQVRVMERSGFELRGSN